MPLIRQKFIFRSDLQANPDVLYLFGDNNERVGLGGQAKEMRGEQNAHGIRTKWRPGMAYSDFFKDEELPAIKVMLEEDFKLPLQTLYSGGIVVLPADGLGTGLSKLPELAPKVNEELLSWIAEMEKHS